MKDALPLRERKKLQASGKIFFNQSRKKNGKPEANGEKSLLMMGKFNFTVCFPSCYSACSSSSSVCRLVTGRKRIL
jgi:hypothetical protein